MTTMESTIEGPAYVARLGRVLSLAGREARRLARHPALWLPLAIAVATMGNLAVTTSFSAGSRYVTIFLIVATLGPTAAIFAASMVASSARRVRADEMLGVTPMSDTERTLAICLGVALTLGGIATAGAVAMSFIAAGAADGSIGAELQTAGELAQIPPIVAGGGLLGVLTARWLRFPGAALVTFVVFVLGGAFVSARLDVAEPGRFWLPWSTSTPVLYEGPEPAGNHWWHSAYLVGLCACATVAAVYRDRSHWPKLAAMGLPVAALTVVFGLLQLP
jgi:hypothetical protein